jgi:hypothetical protein
MKQIDPKTIVQDDFDDAIESTLAGLKASAFIKEKILALAIKESELKEHLATFVKMDEDFHDVQQCRLAGKCLKPQGHYLLDIHRNAIGKLERSLTPCPMLLDQLKVNRFMLIDDSDPNWRDPKLFEELNLRLGRKSLYAMLMKYLTKATQDNLCLIGPHQSGKSFSLAVFAHKYALNELGTVGFLDVATQLPRLVQLKKQDAFAFQRELNKIQRLQLCILDGLSSVQYTEEMLMDVMIPLCNARNKADLITIVTSTVSLQDLHGFFKGYKDKKILMEDWLGMLGSLCQVTLTLPAMQPFKS